MIKEVVKIKRYVHEEINMYMKEMDMNKIHVYVLKSFWIINARMTHNIMHKHVCKCRLCSKPLCFSDITGIIHITRIDFAQLLWRCDEILMSRKDITRRSFTTASNHTDMQSGKGLEIYFSEKTYKQEKDKNFILNSINNLSSIWF